MGPRRCCRGKLKAQRGVMPMRKPLQWGHGDAAVESSETGIHGVPSSRVQWGHGDGAVESQDRAAEKRSIDAASMGPRRCCRGKPGAGTLGTPTDSGLQWGHGDAAVESMMTMSMHRPGRSSFNGATAMLPWK